MTKEIKSVIKEIRFDISQEVRGIVREFFNSGRLNPTNTTICKWEEIGKPSKQK